MRNQHLIVYGSSYDRGLEHLLKIWPDIKKEVPDAELHIFYGWNLFDIGYSDNPERMAWKEKMNNLMTQPGITHLGRISHEACIKEFEKAGIWAYPTHFGEISCITAMRAQAYGAIPCVINYAALKETVQFGVKINGDIYDPETKELYKNGLIALLKDSEYQESVRKEMVPYAAEKFGWSVVAQEWNKEFKRVITPEEKALSLIFQDEPLEALRILEKDSPLRQKLVKKLEHMFDSKKYEEKYANGPMEWKPGVVDYSRHDWILKEAKDAKSLIDLGCYEGSLIKKFNGYSKGVEINKEAIKEAKKNKLNVVEGNADTYRDADLYDAVCACEVIEHVPDPQKLINNMKALVSENGWCYLTTPNGCFDPASTQKVWNDENALIDHVRTYNKENIQSLLGGCEASIIENGKELYVKFRPDMAKAVEELMENNEALKAWDLVKSTNSPLKDRVWLRVKHAFDNKAYEEYYSKDLIEIPVSEDIAVDCTKLAPRFAWVVPAILKNKPGSLIDLGCADGYLCLTMAKKGIPCMGYNLYEPSVKLANDRAKKFGVNAKFITKNLFDVKEKADAVVMMEVIEHLSDPRSAVGHVMGLLNDGGHAFFSTPSPNHVGITQHKSEPGHAGWDDGKPSGHLRIFTEEEFKNLFNEYEIVDFRIDEEGCMNLEVKNK
jgi:2-polyprenyl-3-methyl-5-hydroxy-6-metoxy-1,4-benzoquinol methylase